MQNQNGGAMEALQETLSELKSRRALLKGAIAGTVGVSTLAAAGTALAAPLTGGGVTPIKDILTIARTAERLAVTFYTNGLNNADKLGLHWGDRENIRAALIEEQIHELFFAANGGSVLASEFSFPEGSRTFTDLKTFIATQQQLEGVFDSAFLSAIREFAQQGQPRLAQIAGQIATIEAEHRALGRQIAGLYPSDNWAFSPVLVAKVGDAPALVAKAGYLSPRNGNRYTYHQVSTDDKGVIYRTPYAVGQ